MAGTNIKGEVWGLYINDGTDQSPDWKLAVCSTEDNFSTDVGEITTSGKCTGDDEDAEPGKVTATVSGSGFNQDGVDIDQMSYAELLQITRDREVRGFRYAKSDDSFVVEGKGFFTQFQLNSSDGEYSTYSYNFRVKAGWQINPTT